MPSIRVLGLMSGTSLDGIDAAIIETDGEKLLHFGQSAHLPYSDELRTQLRQAIQTHSIEAEQWADNQITQAHLNLIQKITQNNKVDLIGFHGQTTEHKPEQGFTKQIGSGAVIAQQTGIDVVAQFRQADMAAGGEGAPLAPLYHLALAKKAGIVQPLAVVNIGGIANITYIDEEKGDLLAFDTGMGNGLMDDWINRHLGFAFDEGGKLAEKGKVDEAALLGFMRADYFRKKPPKSLDRNHWNFNRIKGLSVENGMATLLAFTTRAIAEARNFLPRTPKSWIICGGGRHNKTLLTRLEKELNSNVVVAEKVGWQGDMIEAQCFAFLAARSVRGLPLTLPQTTGCAQPTSGGVLFSAT